MYAGVMVCSGLSGVATDEGSDEEAGSFCVPVVTAVQVHKEIQAADKITATAFRIQTSPLFWSEHHTPWHRQKRLIFLWKQFLSNQNVSYP